MVARYVVGDSKSKRDCNCRPWLAYLAARFERGHRNGFVACIGTMHKENIQVARLLHQKAGGCIDMELSLITGRLKVRGKAPNAPKQHLCREWFVPKPSLF